MKVLFTADLHIKLGQKNVPVDWAKNRYKLLIEQLEHYSDQVDLVVIGGDIFDRLPSMEELEVYFNLVSSLRADTFMYSGNHEALKKSTTFLSNLAEVTNKVNPRVKIIDDYFNYKELDFIPYNKLKDWAKDPDNIFIGLGNILCTHVRGDIPPHVKAEIPLELFNRWRIVLAGDLHSYSNSQLNILYPGSPVTTSFHRNLVDTGLIFMDTESLEHKWVKLDLPQLIRKTVGTSDEIIKTDYHHTIYEVEGDMSELGTLENSDLLDKKIVKRSSDVSLILNNEMSLGEEVEEYLRFILNLDDSTVLGVLKELNDHMGKILE